MNKPDRIILISILLILAIAGFFRLWELNSAPPGLYPDEAINGNDAISALGSGNFKVFYPENNGREGLYINLISISFSVFGASVESVRVVSAIIGILTVLGLYFLTKELFKHFEARSRNVYFSERIALFASFFLATSFWHTNFSRIGFRGILVPFILVFAFYFLFKGFRTQKISNFIIGGIFLGLGLYTYIAFRLTALLLIAFLICWWLFYKKKNRQRNFLLFTSCLLLTAFIIALPLGIYFLENPKDFVGRASGVSIFSQNSNPPFSQFQALGASFAKHLGMFNFYGDANWRHNFSGSPILFWPVGLLFLIGLFYSLRNLIKAVKSGDNKKFLLYGFLISWWLILMLPGILTTEGTPHSLRCIGIIPVVFIFSALGTEILYSKIKNLQKFGLNGFNSNGLSRVFLIFILILLGSSFLFTQYFRYFEAWAKNPNTSAEFTQRFVKIGNYLNSLSEGTQKYVIVNEPGVPVPYPDGTPMPAQTIQFLENAKFGGLQAVYLLPEELDQIRIKKGKASQSIQARTEQTVIIPMLYDEDLLNELQRMFSEGKIQQKNGIWMFKIK